jgi:protein TonB
MDFARQQRDPTKHMIGLAVVVLVHALVIYALMTGLGKSIVEVIKKPLSANIIEEVKLPPPPPKKIEPPKVPPPPPPFVPMADIPVPTISTAPVITTTTATPPSAPAVIAPVVQAPPPPPKPAIRRGVSRIAGDDPTYPRAAIKANIDKGHVVARVHIDEKGNVTEVIIVSADPPRHFDRAVIDALSTWKFRAEGEKYVAEVELNFVLKEE